MWATLAAQTESRPLILAQQSLARLDVGQSVALLAAFALSVVFAWLFVSIAFRILAAMARRTSSRIDDRLLTTASGPARLALAVLLFSLLRHAIDLSKANELLLGKVESSLFVAAAFWQALRWLDVATEDYRRRFQRRGQSQAGAMLVAAQRFAKLAALGIAAIMVLDNAGIQVTALLAGVGLGGIAIALAAQKSLENLFGGLTLYLDRPVRVGTFCRFGDRIGEVEEIGLRSTRVRTPDRTLVTVPNAEFANLQLESFQRDKIWFHPTLAIRSNTPADRLRQILAELRELLVKHPRIEPETARVWVTGFGPYSINLDVNAYVKTSDLGEYFAIGEELHLAVMDLLAEHDSGIAFSAPSEFK